MYVSSLVIIQIDVALRFFGNSSNTYSIPVKATSAPLYSTTISMLFRPESTNSSGYMFAIQENQSDTSVALRMNYGTVDYEYYADSSVSKLSVSNIREGEWYQLYASL